MLPGGLPDRRQEVKLPNGARSSRISTGSKRSRSKSNRADSPVHPASPARSSRLPASPSVSPSARRADETRPYDPQNDPGANTKSHRRNVPGIHRLRFGGVKDESHLNRGLNTGVRPAGGARRRSATRGRPGFSPRNSPEQNRERSILLPWEVVTWFKEVRFLIQ